MTGESTTICGRGGYLLGSEFNDSLSNFFQLVGSTLSGLSLYKCKDSTACKNCPEETRFYRSDVGAGLAGASAAYAEKRNQKGRAIELALQEGALQTADERAKEFSEISEDL